LGIRSGGMLDMLGVFDLLVCFSHRCSPLVHDVGRPCREHDAQVGRTPALISFFSGAQRLPGPVQAICSSGIWRANSGTINQSISRFIFMRRI
jgi:hypothetical protein